VPDAISRYSQDPRIVVMVRHPADLLYSLYCLTAMGAFHTGDPPLLPFSEFVDESAAATIPEAMRSPLGCRDLARLAEPVERYMRVFGRDRVHVVVFDDLARSTDSTYARVADFLGIARESVVGPPVQSHERMPSRRPGPGRLPPWLLAPPPAVRGAARALMPSSLRKRVVSVARQLDRGRPERLDPALRKRLSIEFREEIQRLGDVIQRDLTSWYDT
jgi:hypothetical protein